MGHTWFRQAGSRDVVAHEGAEALCGEPLPIFGLEDCLSPGVQSNAAVNRRSKLTPDRRTKKLGTKDGELASDMTRANLSWAPAASRAQRPVDVLWKGLLAGFGRGRKRTGLQGSARRSLHV
jgi:hypothetical protein